MESVNLACKVGDILANCGAPEVGGESLVIAFATPLAILLGGLVGYLLSRGDRRSRPSAPRSDIIKD